MKIILVGNQNSGKSSLFNALTKSTEAVGNRAGVTVDATKKEVTGSKHTLVDLPGTYSLSPFTEEEKITCEYVNSLDYDLILNVVGCTDTERSFNLTLQLKSVNKPVIVVFNMADRLKKSGVAIDKKAFEKYFGLPAVFASSVKKDGTEELRKMLDTVPQTPHHLTRPLTAEQRFAFIEKVIFSVVKGRKKRTASDVIDKIVLNRYLAIPIFTVVMFAVYSLSVGVVGKSLSSGLTNALNSLSDLTEKALVGASVNTIVVSLIKNGVLCGICSVLSFLPQLAILFLLLSVLEGTGYMTRAAFIFERLFGALGLSGKSIVPFIIGSGCSVPAIMSARTIDGRQERALTVMLTPFVPCSAKLPIIALFADFFYHDASGLFVFSAYFSSVVIIIFSAVLLRPAFPKRFASPFIYELTEYKLPNLKQSLNEVFIKLFSFIKRVGTTVLACSIVMWTLSTFTPSLTLATSPDESMLAFIGKIFSPLLVPVIGVNSWQATVCAMQGIIAKEQVVSAMNVLAGLENATVFGSNAFGFFDRASAYAFVCFNLFSPPCISAISAMRAEIGVKKTAAALIYQLSAAILFGFGIRILLTLF